MSLSFIYSSQHAVFYSQKFSSRVRPGALTEGTGMRQAKSGFQPRFAEGTGSHSEVSPAFPIFAVFATVLKGLRIDNSCSVAE